MDNDNEKKRKIFRKTYMYQIWINFDREIGVCFVLIFPILQMIHFVYIYVKFFYMYIILQTHTHTHTQMRDIHLFPIICYTRMYRNCKKNHQIYCSRLLSRKNRFSPPSLSSSIPLFILHHFLFFFVLARENDDKTIDQLEYVDLHFQ